MHGRIKTKEELFKRHIQISMDCEYCGQEKDDVIHVLRDCVVAKRIWNHLVPGMFKQSFFSLNLRAWLCFNLGKAGINKVVDEWACLFGVAVWKIWFWCNQFIFTHNLSSHTMPLAALRWSRKLDRGFMISILQEQVSMLFVLEKSSKKLAGKLPRNPFSN